MKRIEIVKKLQRISNSIEQITVRVAKGDIKAYDVVCSLGASQESLGILLDKIGPKKGSDKL